MENHGENKVPNICILSCVFITGYITAYVTNHFDTHKFTSARQKLILWIKQKIWDFDKDKTSRALKMIAWSFAFNHTEKWLNADYPILSNWVERFNSNLLRLKFAFKFT